MEAGKISTTQQFQCQGTPVRATEQRGSLSIAKMAPKLSSLTWPSGFRPIIVANPQVENGNLGGLQRKTLANPLQGADVAGPDMHAGHNAIVAVIIEGRIVISEVVITNPDSAALREANRSESVVRRD